MGTRSDIIVEKMDGTWHRIYCHWDGYLDHNGRLLHEHYASQELAEALVAGGDLSSLAERCDEPPAGHSFDNRVAGYCVYYGRDRGETGVGGQTGDSLAKVWPGEKTGTEFTYVWRKDDARWFVADADEGAQALKPLGDVLAGKAEPPLPNIKAFGGNFVIGKRRRRTEG